MDGVLIESIRMLRRLDDDQLAQVLYNESRRLEITKSLLNLLFNICLTRAVPLSHRLKVKFRRYDKIALELLTGASRQINRTRNLTGKRRILLRNPDLVRLLAEACPSRVLPGDFLQSEDPWLLEERSPAGEEAGEAETGDQGRSLF